jgi:hypothetical protein
MNHIIYQPNSFFLIKNPPNQLTPLNHNQKTHLILVVHNSRKTTHSPPTKIKWNSSFPALKVPSSSLFSRGKISRTSSF